MKKRILSLLLTLAMVLTLAPVAFATGDDAAQDANSTEAVDTVQTAEAEDAETAVENAVAKIGDTEYATLQEALDAVKTGETVQMLANVDLGNATAKCYTSKNKATNVTVDLGGYILTSAASATVTLSATNWTIRNGTIKNTYPQSVRTGGAVNIPSGSTVTLTGGQKGLKIDSIGNGVTIRINNGVANVTVEDGVEISGAYGAYLYGSPQSYTGQYTGKTALTVNGGKIEGSTAGIAVWGPYKKNTKASATLTVNGGTISSTTGYGIAGTGEGDYLGDTINITGGTITSAKDVAIYHPEAGSISISGGTVSGVTGGVQMCAGSLNVTGGTIIATGNGDVSGKTGDGSIPDGAAVSVVNRNYPGGTPSATITGGTLTSASGVGAVQAYTWASNAKADWAEAKSNTSISGGIFSSDVMDYCVSGYETVKGDGGTYTVEDHRIAEIDGVGYASMQKAVDAAKDGDTIKLLADVDLPGCVTINKSITLDLNGKKIYNTKDIWHDKDKNDEKDKNVVAMFDIEDGANVTITGNGTLQAKENDCYNINIVDGNLTIENGTFIGNVSAVQVEKGHLAIKGGKFDLLQKWNGNKFLINCIDKAYKDGSATVAISGGTFVDFDPANNTAEGNGTNFCASGYKTEETNGMYVVKAGTNDAISAIDAALKAIENNSGDKDDKINAALEEVAKIPNATLSGNSSTMDKLGKLNAAAEGSVTVEVNNSSDHKGEVTAKNAALSAKNVTTEQKVVIDITKKDDTDGAIVAAAKTAAQADATMSATPLDITMRVNGTTVTTPSAPVVLTFALPDGWANAKIVRVNGDSTEIVSSTVSNGNISGVFNHFSTYVLVQTEAAINLNQYEFILTPDKTDVSAGDELTYKVTLKHTAGNNADTVGYFVFAPTIENQDLLELDTESSTAVTGDSNIAFVQNDGVWEFTMHVSGSGKTLNVGDTMDVGTLVYKVKAYDTDKTAVLVTGGAKDQITNARYQNSLTPTMSITNEVTYHVIKVTFKQDDNTSDKVYYAKYGTSDLYETADLTGNTVSVAEPTDTSTEYRLADKKWHLSTDLSQTYETTTEFKESVTYVTKKIPLVGIEIPKDIVTVPSTDEHPVTDRNGNKYVDKNKDLTFTVEPAPTPGERYDVTVVINGEDVPKDKITWGTDADGKVTGTIPGDLVIGDVSFKHNTVLDLSADDIGIFTKGTEDDGTYAYLEYSKYSGKDTLVLIKGKTGANYTLGKNQPTIYATTAYDGYTHAVLVPKQETVSKEAMLTYLQKELGLQATTVENTSVDPNSWDTNGNGNTDRDLGDVQATNDFKTFKEDEDWHWNPTDELLLLADVLTIKDKNSDAQNKENYTKSRDGQVSDDDVNAFVYLYAKLGK